MGRKELLFDNYELRAVLEGQLKKAEGAVVALPATEVAVEAEESVIDKLEEEYRVIPLELLEDKVTVEQEEAQADVSGDPLRFIRDRSQPFYVPGQRVRYYVPYRGDQELWHCRPSSFTLNPPSADVAGDEIVFEFTVPGADIAQTKGWFDTAIASVRQWISFSKQDVEIHNRQLRSILRDALRRRRDLLSKAAKEVEALGLPVRRKVAPAPEMPMPVAAPSARTVHGRMPPQETREYDVALSFAGEDREYVEKVATLLRSADVRVFYDKFETVQLWGRNLADHLGHIYGKRSRFVVLFVSKHYPAKAWPTHERQNAQARAIRENRMILLPARFDDTDIPGLPSTTGYIDLKSTTPEELAELIKKKLGENA